MTAQYAKEMTNAAIKEMKLKELKEIDEVIKAATLEGHFDIQLYSLFDETIDYLRKSGFFVTYNDGSYIVSWK